MSLNYTEFKRLIDSTKELQKGHEKFIRSFLLKQGLKWLRETKKLTPVDTGYLRNSWELSDVFRNGDELFIVLTNRADYASFVEDGHMTRNRSKWVAGKHMARISLTKLENQLPAAYDTAFKQFVKGLGM